MAPELEACRGEFDAVAADASDLLATLSDAQFYLWQARQLLARPDCPKGTSI